METAEGLLTASRKVWGWRMEKKDLKFVSFFFFFLALAKFVEKKWNNVCKQTPNLVQWEIS